MAVFTAGAVGVDFDILDLAPLAFAPVSGATSTSEGLLIGGVSTQLFGSAFSRAANELAPTFTAFVSSPSN